uniref:Uncharacterized protein n=1 Tax=Vitis vinifera TaxID=29760 RepID=A5BXB7_VITVI|nr:hypothetical protein VITISV_032373 [Vitis vinifera]
MALRGNLKRKENKWRDMGGVCLGIQESNTSNGVQIRAQTKKLWLFEDNHAKLSENFATAKSTFPCETTCKHTCATSQVETPSSQLRTTLRNHLQVAKSQIQLAKSKFKLAKWTIQTQTNSEDVFLEDEWLGFLSLGVKKVGCISERDLVFEPIKWKHLYHTGSRNNSMLNPQCEKKIPVTRTSFLYEKPEPSDLKLQETLFFSDIVHILSKGASTRQYLLRKELPPSMFFIDALLRHNIFPLQHWVQRRGVLLKALFRISEGFFFGPRHLIMAALLYFEEKVHRKKLLRADAIPLLFPRLLCQILEHLGYPSEPQLKRRCICREIFTLDKWTSMTTYGAESGALDGLEHPEIPHPEQPKESQLVKIPADMRAPAPVVPSIEPIPEVAPSAPPATPRTPLVIPSTSKPPPPFEPRIAISILEYRGLCHTLQTLTTSQSILTQQMTAFRAHQEQLIATQTQHTTILRQIQHATLRTMFSLVGGRVEEGSFVINAKLFW